MGISVFNNNFRYLDEPANLLAFQEQVNLTNLYEDKFGFLPIIRSLPDEIALDNILFNQLLRKCLQESKPLEHYYPAKKKV